MNAQPLATDIFRRDGYTIEKVIYESRPNHHVTANLYLPSDASQPVPGVLVPCGHSANGKAADAYQSICISLARHGMAALIYDPISQGERFQVLDEKGTPLTGAATGSRSAGGVNGDRVARHGCGEVLGMNHAQPLSGAGERHVQRP